MKIKKFLTKFPEMRLKAWAKSFWRPCGTGGDTASHTEKAVALIENGADLTARGENNSTVLMAATFWGNEKVIKALLDKNVPVNDKDEDGRTALLYVSYLQENSESIIKMLLDAGAAINEQETVVGHTALTLAAEAEHAEIVQLLLDRGADTSL